MDLAEDLLDSLMETYAPRTADFEAWDLDALKREVARIFSVDVLSMNFADRTADEIRDALWVAVKASYDLKEKLVGPDVLRRIERDFMLHTVDTQWKDHLYSLDHLKEGIGLRGYGQRDPLVEYKRESFQMFQAMKDRVDEETVRTLWSMRLVAQEGTDAGASIPAPRRAMPKPPPRFSRPPLIFNNPSEAVPVFAGAGASTQAPPSPGRQPQPVRVGGDDVVKTVRRDEPKVGRNDPCPCGSGKKYKKCHGAGA
jgi:preprotein translocase subunit SecA